MNDKLKEIWNRIRNMLPRRWLVILAVGILLLLLLLIFLQKILPNNNPANLYSYYGISPEDTVVFINTERVEMNVLLEDEQIYLPLDAVVTHLNQRFYYDTESRHVLYAMPDRIDEFEPEKRSYTEGSVTASAKTEPYIVRDGISYLSLEIIERYTRLQYEEFSEPDRLWIWTAFDEDIPYLYTEKPVYLRTGAGYGNPVLNRENPGDTYILISEEKNWSLVFSGDGNIGYLPKRKLKEPVMIRRSGDFFDEQVYGTRQLKEKLSVGFDYIDNVSYGLDMLKLHLEEKEAVNVFVPTWFVLRGNEGEFSSCADPEYVSLAHDEGCRNFECSKLL